MARGQQPEALQQATRKDTEMTDKQHMQELAAYRFTVENLRERVAELEAQLEAAPQAVQDAVPMVNMTPPATQRDRWMYEQGRLAERDARTVGSVTAATISATQPAAQGMEADLTDAQIDEAFNQMPDGAAGFLKSWGYRQFARAVLAAQAKQGGV